MEQDDHLTCYDIADSDYGMYGIDYVGDERDDEDALESLENALPKEMFDINRKKRSVTVRREGIKIVLRQMVSAIRDSADALNEDNVTDWMMTFRLRMSIENYKNGHCLFHFDGETQSLNQFICDIAAGDADTLYLGAALDYHI